MLQAKNIAFQYPDGRELAYPDFSIEKGESKLLIGPSGCGKTTLLNIFALLVQNFEGELTINNTNIQKLSKAEQDEFRANNIGVIFQEQYFIASLNVIENIGLASKLNKQELTELAADLGIENLLHKKVKNLSLGEKQRVSIARVIAQQPVLILADEPTSSLDDVNATVVIDLLQQQALKNNAALLIVTHDQRIKSKIKSVVEL